LPNQLDLERELEEELEEERLRLLLRVGLSPSSSL
jgi:hypothetical protein